MVAVLILPVYLTEKGISLPIVTIISAIFLLPMTIKFFWGGIVDYYIKYGRKKFIIFGGVLSSISLISLSFIDPNEFLIIFTFFLFLAGMGVGFLDVSADVWAIEISKYNERGKINGAMFAGQSIGMIAGASFLALIAENYGYTLSFLTTGLIVLAIIIFPLIIKETKINKKRHKIGKILFSEFKKKTTIIISIFTPISGINIGILGILIPLYLKLQLQLEISHIGAIISIWSATRVIGSLIGGILSDRWGRKQVLYIVLGGGCFFTLLFIFANTWQIVALIYGIIGLIQGGLYSTWGAMLMDVTNPKVGATQYSILTSLGNAGITAGESLCGTIAVAIGFTGTFLFTSWLFGPALLILYFIRLKKNIITNKI
jgi:MFS family permease